MEILVIETGHYNDRYVFGVASSLESAVAMVKATYSAPYRVNWKPWANPQSTLTGYFHGVAGYSAPHTADFDFSEYVVDRAPA